MKWPWNRKIGADARKAGAAIRRQDWAEAVWRYRKITILRPRDPAYWVQYGHALKESGNLEAAEGAYARAMDLSPEDLDARLHHSRSLAALGRSSDALKGFVEILIRDPNAHDAYAELVHAGARHLIPQDGHRIASRDQLGNLTTQIANLSHDIHQWVDLSTYPLSAYAAFRRDFPITPPPRNLTDCSFAILIDARATAPAYLRATLLSLIDQTHQNWSAMVVAPDWLCEHPLASIEKEDPRCSFVTAPIVPQCDWVLHLSSGTILDPQALDWCRFVGARTKCDVAWCDSDHAVQHWRDGFIYERPQLWGVFDLDLLAATDAPPPVVMFRNSGKQSVEDLLNAEDGEVRRRVLIGATDEPQRVVHIPRILASVLRLPDRATLAPQGNETIRNWSTDPGGFPPQEGPISGHDSLSIISRDGRVATTIATAITADQRLQIIIPTRDAAELLERAVDTMIDLADRPDRLTITIVDNRSVETRTTELLSQWQRAERVSVLPLDEPFNWSRANNLAAARSDTDAIVFANNDIEMLTSGWDTLLLGYLQRPDVGVVGARLLYPDHSIQHGGMLFGLGEGGPRHDGVGLTERSSGLSDRYDLTHMTVAVTGAFQAVRRDVFTRAGGLDALLFPVGYNDIDLCMRIRALGLGVLYVPTIELIHHESKTRGINNNRARVAMDQGEWATLYERWGTALLTDPGYNLHWSRDRAFDGYRNPALSQILDHLDLAASETPWIVKRQDHS